MENSNELYTAMNRLKRFGVHITDFEIYKFQSLIQKINDQLDDVMMEYLENFLNKAIDLSDAIKEMSTPHGNDQQSVRKQRELLNWFESQTVVIDEKHA